MVLVTPEFPRPLGVDRMDACSRQSVYKKFLTSDWLDDGTPPPSYSSFDVVWNKYCGHIKLKKLIRFALCDLRVYDGLSTILGVRIERNEACILCAMFGSARKKNSNTHQGSSVCMKNRS